MATREPLMLESPYNAVLAETYISRLTGCESGSLSWWYVHSGIVDTEKVFRNIEKYMECPDDVVKSRAILEMEICIAKDCVQRHNITPKVVVPNIDIIELLSSVELLLPSSRWSEVLPLARCLRIGVLEILLVSQLDVKDKTLNDSRLVIKADDRMLRTNFSRSDPLKTIGKLPDKDWNVIFKKTLVDFIKISLLKKLDMVYETPGLFSTLSLTESGRQALRMARSDRSFLLGVDPDQRITCIDVQGVV